MSDRTPCNRHARTVWMAYCPACTAWHLAVEIARRNGSGSSLDPQSAPSASRTAVTRAAVPVGAAAPIAA
jgi:hypothetical protein